MGCGASSKRSGAATEVLHPTTTTAEPPASQAILADDIKKPTAVIATDQGGPNKKLKAEKRENDVGKHENMQLDPSQVMMIGDGIEIHRLQYLAGFRETSVASYPVVPLPEERSEFTVDGSIDDVAKQKPDLTGVLYNDVKVCAKCSKPCAFTLTTCNSCGASLKDVEMGKSPNVFTAFLLGLKKAPNGMPLTISIRRQTEDVLIFDDLLALAACHLNCIPRKHYIPDWRFLLRDPKKALELLTVMEDECWRAMRPFLDHEGFRTSIYRERLSDEDLRKRIIRCFNYPPSQFQLHIQWIVPPFVPFQHYMAETNNHLTENRCFPMEYVREVLELGIPYKVDKHTPIEEVIEFYKGHGVDYSQVWATWFDQSLQSTRDLQNWKAADFEYTVKDNAVWRYDIVDREVKATSKVEGVTAADLQKRDKLALQNYGRPYTAEGKPSGTYIRSQLALQPKLGEGGYTLWPGVDIA